MDHKWGYRRHGCPEAVHHGSVSELRLLDSLRHNKLLSLEVNWGRETRSPLPKFIDTGTIVVDKGNVDEFVRQAQDSKDN